MISTYWKAIHSDKVLCSENLEDKPYTKINRATLQKVIFYEKGKEDKPIVEFNNPKDIFFRLRPLLTNLKLAGRRWVIENDGKICIIDYENKPKFYNSYKEADTFPLKKSPIDFT
jgi:hypothetical protein